MDDQLVLKHLFGERAGEIGSPTNCLLLEDQLEGWFDKYQFVIVPVDPSEVPITRWKDQPKAKDTLDQRELVFLNHNRPASRFLFFRFMLALIRIRQLKRTGWEDVWARYRTNKPFATPGRYTRTGMLLAMAAHNEITAPEEIEGFLRLVEAEKVPRTITLPEAEILRVKEEVAKAIESFETARDNHEDRENEDTDTEDDELEYSTMDDGYEDDDDQDDDSG
ncbi:hypothetical protein QBC45DRAFT_325613 [Copromyces sp. CBS 386.78]|nr:hypothetical protein QBC45DRAFT_325613 [Copromyces sp. CBS 386.78]